MPRIEMKLVTDNKHLAPYYLPRPVFMNDTGQPEFQTTHPKHYKLMVFPDGKSRMHKRQIESIMRHARLSGITHVKNLPIPISMYGWACDIARDIGLVLIGRELQKMIKEAHRPTF